jgi:hypothetical protein
MGAVVVEDHVDHLAGRHGALERVEEADELLVPLALHAAADHRAVEHVERREQGGRAVALGVVGPCGAVGTPHPTRVPQRPFFSGRPGWVRSSAWIWLGAGQRASLSSIDSTTAWAGGSTYNPTMSSTLAAKLGSVETLQRRT